MSVTTAHVLSLSERIGTAIDVSNPFTSLREGLESEGAKSGIQIIISEASSCFLYTPRACTHVRDQINIETWIRADKKKSPLFITTSSKHPGVVMWVRRLEARIYMKVHDVLYARSMHTRVVIYINSISKNFINNTQIINIIYTVYSCVHNVKMNNTLYTLVLE